MALAPAAPMAVVPAPPPRQVLVHIYEYYMDNVFSGKLYLQENADGSGDKKCKWKSASTGLSTRWHGTWSRARYPATWNPPAEWLYFRFDFLGRPKEGEKKWGGVQRCSETSFRYCGNDYQLRQIDMIFRRTWRFDESVGAYITSNDE